MIFSAPLPIFPFRRLIDEQKMNWSPSVESVAIVRPLQRMRDIMMMMGREVHWILLIVIDHKRSTILTHHHSSYHKKIGRILLFSRDIISSSSTNDIKLLHFFLERENGWIEQEIGRSSLLPRLILYDNEVSSDHFVDADQHHAGFVVSVGCRK